MTRWYHKVLYLPPGYILAVLNILTMGVIKLLNIIGNAIVWCNNRISDGGNWCMERAGNNPKYHSLDDAMAQIRSKYR